MKFLTFAIGRIALGIGGLVVMPVVGFWMGLASLGQTVRTLRSDFAVEQWDREN